MPRYHVSLNDELGRPVEANEPVGAARSVAAQMDVAAGGTLFVRWDVTLDPKDARAWLMAKTREVVVETSHTAILHGTALRP